MAPTIVPPPPEPAGVSARLPGRAATGASDPDPCALDVKASFESGVQPAGGAAAAAEPPSGQATREAGEVPARGAGPPDERESREVDVSDASEAIPEWAGSAPSVGLVANLKGAPGSGRRILFLAASGVGVMVLAALAVAVVLGSGKKRSGPDQKRAAVPTVVGAERAAAPAKPATGEKPALPTAVVQPVKPQPAAEEKPLAPAKSQPAAAEKVAAPAEKPAAPEKPAPAVIPAAEKPRPVEKKVAAEKPAAPVEKPAPPERPAAAKPVAAPKPAVEKPAAAKVRTAGEPAAPRPEKKPAEVAPPAAKPATNKAQEAAEAYQRGNAKLLSGALPEAIAAFSEALKLNPKDPQSQRGLGMAYAQAGNAAKAVRHLKLYLKASPNAPDRALIEKRIDQLGGR